MSGQAICKTCGQGVDLAGLQTHDCPGLGVAFRRELDRYAGAAPSDQAGSYQSVEEYNAIAADRSKRPDVRNPVLSLPAAGRLQAMSPEVRLAVAEVFRDLSLDARARAQVSWRKNKGPMAAYWKAVGAYATHIYRAVRP